MKSDWWSELGTFEESLFFLKDATGELGDMVNTQWPNIEYMIGSVVNKRGFGHASGRTLQALKFLSYNMKNRLGYDGNTRPCFYIVAEDPNVTAHYPDKDVGIIVTGSTTTGPAVQGAKVLSEEGVKMFLITYSSLEAVKKRQRKYKEETGKELESVWDYLVKQDDFEKHVVYIPSRYSDLNKQRREEEDRKRASLAPMGTKFEDCAALFFEGMLDTIADYHLRYEGSETIPVKTMSDTIKFFIDYYDKSLVPGCYKIQDDIYDFIKDLTKSNHVKIAPSGESEIVGRSFTIRLANCGLDGLGKSVHIVDSSNYGPPGSSNIKAEDLVIGISVSGLSSHTINIMKEAERKGTKKIWLLTSNPHSELSDISKTLVIPSTYPGYTREFGHLGAQIFLDATIAQLAKNLGLDEKDLRDLHSRYG